MAMLSMLPNREDPKRIRGIGAEISVLSDYDFHPDEATVRIFRTPMSGVVRFDDAIAVTMAI